MIIKEKADLELVCRCDMQLFASFSSSEQRKEVDFCRLTKIYCYPADFEKEKGLNFPFISQSPHGVHAPPYRKMQLHFSVFDMDI